MTSPPSAPVTSRILDSSTGCTCISERLVEMIVFKSETRIRESLSDELRCEFETIKKIAKEMDVLKTEFEVIKKIAKGMETRTSRMEDDCKRLEYRIENYEQERKRHDESFLNDFALFCNKVGFIV